MTKLSANLTGPDSFNGLAWFLLAFAIFNTCMLLWSLRVNIAVRGVFLALEITEILLVIGMSPTDPAGGRPLWDRLPDFSKMGSPLLRRAEA